MKVKMIKTGEVKTVNDSYGLRLITQGQAVVVKTAAEKKPEKKPSKAAAGE